MKFSIKHEIKFFYDAYMKYISFFGSFIFWIFGVVLFYILNQKDFAIRFFLAAACAMAVEYSIKSVFKEKRPDFNKVKPISIFEKFQEAGSFPSGHTANIAVFTVLVALRFKIMPLTILFSLITISTMFSRIYLKRHYVKDVIGGLILGIIMGYLFA
jgi:membrane-associated phospholipid phosphatase